MHTVIFILRIMSKTYEHIEDEPMMVNESLAEVYSNTPQHVFVPIHALNNVTTPYTTEELETHLQESELEFESGRFLTMEEADRDMECFINSL